MKYTDDAMNIYLGNYFLAKKLKKRFVVGMQII